jgi:hypothetical protein
MSEDEFALECFEILLEDAALGADEVVSAVLALGVIEDVVTMEADFVAFAADEGLVSGQFAHVLLALAVRLDGHQGFLLFVEHQLLVCLRPAVVAHPNAAQLAKRTVLRAFQFVDVVMEGIAGFDEAGGVGFNGQLDLAQDGVVEPDVDENVVGAVLESVLDPHDAELLCVLFVLVQPDELVVDTEDLLLLGGQFAAHEVAHFEGNQIRG